jgi:hypothetical protein
MAYLNLFGGTQSEQPGTLRPMDGHAIQPQAASESPNDAVDQGP